MVTFGYIAIFLISCTVLHFASQILVKNLTEIGRILEWKEFVVSFFIMAFAGSLPNLFLAIVSILNKTPEISLGDVVGGNVIDLTLAIGLAAIIAPKGIVAKSRTVQTSSIFTLIAAIAPLLLLIDGSLSRGDGLIMLVIFFAYIYWLFSKEERFKKIYDDNGEEQKDKLTIKNDWKIFLKKIGFILLGLILLLSAAEGIIQSSLFFSQKLGTSIALISILIIGLGNALPETYFAISSAKKDETWLILGDLMGAVVIPSSLVLGIVGLASPFFIDDFSPFAISRLFLIISSVFFFIFVRTNQKVTKREGIILLSFYVFFVITQLIFQ
ncbi:MAG TPA: hypothetical protein P5083_01195 [Candidatus Paceibacterota bacterium]|nr:hypothetical protein [Candidatus Paceibacterota bacterium]